MFEKDRGEYHVRVVKQILWVNGKRAMELEILSRAKLMRTILERNALYASLNFETLLSSLVVTWYTNSLFKHIQKFVTPLIDQDSS